jgi:hypothetical protein
MPSTLPLHPGQNPGFWHITQQSHISQFQKFTAHHHYYIHTIISKKKKPSQEKSQAVTNILLGTLNMTSSSDRRRKPQKRPRAKKRKATQLLVAMHELEHSLLPCSQDEDGGEARTPYERHEPHAAHLS